MFKFDNISKRFDSRVIANQINFQVKAGEMLAILGSSGSGKSTLLNIAAGLQPPDSGDIWLDNERITTKPPEKRQIAMMFQDFALLPHLNVWENVAIGLRLQGVKKTLAYPIATNMLAEVGLQHASDRNITQLSGGEQQRVALARALIISPKLLLLDEPFSSLDTTLRQHLQRELTDLIKQKKIPTIIVSHDPAEAALSAQHIALLANGQIIQYGTPSELFECPISAQAARLLGCLNVFDKMYIPQSAICFHHPNGTQCTIQRRFRLPLSWHVECIHPKFGELITLVGDDVGQHLHRSAQIWINPEKIIHF